MKTLHQVAAAVIFLACAAGSALAGGPPTGVTGEWGLPASEGVLVTFDGKGHVSGASGCNRFMGTYKVGKHSLKVGPLAGTRMLCDDAKMKIEALFLADMARVRKYEKSATELKLLDGQKKPIMTLHLVLR